MTNLKTIDVRSGLVAELDAFFASISRRDCIPIMNLVAHLGAALAIQFPDPNDFRSVIGIMQEVYARMSADGKLQAIMERRYDA